LGAVTSFLAEVLSPNIGASGCDFETPESVLFESAVSKPGVEALDVGEREGFSEADELPGDQVSWAQRGLQFIIEATTHLQSLLAASC
jgi:hypothetical protein